MKSSHHTDIVIFKELIIQSYLVLLRIKLTSLTVSGETMYIIHWKITQLILFMEDTYCCHKFFLTVLELL